MSANSSFSALRLVMGLSNSNRVPVEDVFGALERRQRAGEGAFELRGELFRGPAVGAVDGADRPRLVEQEDLVVAHRQDLSGNTGRRIGTEIDRKRRNFSGVIS